MRCMLGLLLLSLSLTACGASPTPIALPTLVPFPPEGALIVTPTQVTVAEQATIFPSTTPIQLPTSTPAEQDQPIDTVVAIATALPTQTPTLRPIEPTQLALTAFPEIAVSRYANITYNAAIALVRDTPLVVFPTEHVRQIYERGRYRGLRDDFLLSVGDCNSESVWYLESLLDDTPPDSTTFAQYYENQLVQSTINHFSTAFAFKGQSVNSGLNAASVLDPFWASADVCPFGESPLTCDYYNTESFASLIMFGANDINVLSTAGYEMAMRDIIETTLERDIIPIISTFSVRLIEGDNTYAIGVRFNAVLIQLAEEYQIPLVNFFMATRDLADRGILEDNAHLTVGGFNIRNQLTVEVLTQLRTEILTETRNS